MLIQMAHSIKPGDGAKQNAGLKARVIWNVKDESVGALNDRCVHSGRGEQPRLASSGQ